MLSDIKIVKRDGRLVPFDKTKIAKAIISANKDVDECFRISSEEANEIANDIEKECCESDSNLSVEEVQNCVEIKLMQKGFHDLAREYIKYRYVHNLARNKYKELMDAVQSKISASNVQNQNANVDEKSFGGRIGEASSYLMKQYALDYLMSDMAKNNHLNNEIYIHDLDSYSVRNAQLFINSI